MGCKSDAAFSTIPVGRICVWQSKQLPGWLSKLVVSTGWNWPFCNPGVGGMGLPRESIPAWHFEHVG